MKVGLKAIALLSLPGAYGFSNNAKPAAVTGTGTPSSPGRLQSPTRNLHQDKYTGTTSSYIYNPQTPSNAQMRLRNMMLMAVPILDNWTITRRGEASGVVKNHPDPNIFDGELLTTSKLATMRDQLKEGATVVTASGSKYRLGKERGGAKVSPSPSPWGSFAMMAPKPPKSPPKRATATSTTKKSFGGWGASKVANLDKWTVTVRGEVKGVVSNYPDPSIEDGDTITTSKINEDRNSLLEGSTITTSSGSKYVLGKKKGGFDPFGSASSPSAESRGGTFRSRSKALKDTYSSKAPAPAPQAPAPPASAPFNPFGTFQMIGKSASKSRSLDNGKTTSSSSSTSSSASSKSQKSSNGWGSFALNNNDRTSPSSTPRNSGSVKEEAARISNLRDLKLKYGVNGKTVGGGRYLLCDKPQRSTSGKSNIWSAYRADKEGLPMGNKLTIKVSNNFDAISREADNYNRVCSGLFPGRFVDKSEFLSDTDGSPSAEFRSSCALVIESGRKDLKAILSERGGRGFEGRAMRDAAIASLQCVQAMHSSGIVWTDLKTENFVIVSDEIGDNGFLPGVKGIDLESAMPKGSNPVDFSPEACPPEFAAAFISGEGLEFTLEYSYDIWSYGMMLYELTTGRCYFGSKTPAQITKSLQYGDDFDVDVSLVADSKLRDLIGMCLQSNPKKRPGISQLLLHPYFLSSGIGQFSF